MTGKELIKLSGKTSVSYWTPEMLKKGVAVKTKSGRVDYLESAIDFMQNLPKTDRKTYKTGKKTYKEWRKEKITAELLYKGIVSKDVFYCYVRKPGKGWWYKDLKGKNIFLADTYQQVLDKLKG